MNGRHPEGAPARPDEVTWPLLSGLIPQLADSHVPRQETGLGLAASLAPGDTAVLIPDEEAIPYIFDLLEHEGLCLGGSSAINIAGAVRLAKELGPGKVIVTLLCDSGTRYQSKLYNPDFLRSKNLPVPDWLERKTTVKPPFV